MKKSKTPDENKNRYGTYSYPFKKQVAEQVLNGFMSQRYAAEKYNISRNTISSWCEKFGPDMKEKNITKNEEIKRLQDKIEELELVKDIQQDILAQFQKQVGVGEMEKRLPKQLFDEIQRIVKTLK